MLTYEFLRPQAWFSPEQIDDINCLFEQLSLEATTKKSALPRISLRALRQIKHDYCHVLLVKSDEEPTRHDRIIGTGTLAVIPVLTGSKGNIEDVVVHDTYRGRNIGEEIMKRLIARARELHLAKLELTSHARRIAANRLYQKLDFERRETNCYRLEIEKK